MRKLLLLAAMCVSFSGRAQSLPVAGKTLIIDPARRESTPAVFVEIHRWAKSERLPVSVHLWLLGGFNVSQWSASGGTALVVSSSPIYAGIAALTTSGKQSTIGFVGGLVGHF